MLVKSVHAQSPRGDYTEAVGAAVLRRYNQVFSQTVHSHPRNLKNPRLPASLREPRLPPLLSAEEEAQADSI